VCTCMVSMGVSWANVEIAIAYLVQWSSDRYLEIFPCRPPTAWCIFEDPRQPTGVPYCDKRYSVLLLHLCFLFLKKNVGGEKEYITTSLSWANRRSGRIQVWCAVVRLPAVACSSGVRDPRDAFPPVQRRIELYIGALTLNRGSHVG
jgi:hypothetical protein